MSHGQQKSLTDLLDAIESDDHLPRDEFEDIVADLETGKKYTVSSYNMFCTSENILVICDMDTEEFIQIEVPMNEDEEIVVTRD